MKDSQKPDHLSRPLDHIAPRILSRGCFTPENVHDILVSKPAEVLTFR